MSWLFSRVLVEEYLEENCLDGEQSVPLNGSPMPQAYLCSDKMMGFSRLSQFGMTFRLLTADRGEALLTSYLGDFPVRTSQQQEREKGLMASDQACGEKWQGSFAKYDPDTHSLRTHQCSLLEDLTESCQTLPAWGLMRDGECWEQPTLELRIRGTESGSLQKMWLTPRASDVGSGEKNTTFIKRMGDRTERCAQSLAAQVNNPATWPTPTAHNAKETNAPNEALRNEPTLASRVGGKLNPTWVEWLMGWPLEWTDLKPLATDKFQQWQQQHGNC
jgi:hypothetical protein